MNTLSLDTIINNMGTITIEQSGIASLAYILQATQREHTSIVLLPSSALHELYSYSSIFYPAYQKEWALFPSIEEYYKDSRMLQAKAMEALYMLAYTSPAVIVIPYSQLYMKFPTQSIFENNTIDIYKGMELPYETFVELLSLWGYQTVSTVFRCGDIARRGDILDIYPPNIYHTTKRGHVESLPIRIEFFGDTIEDIRIFSPDTQRFLEPLRSCTLFPITMAPQYNESNIKEYYATLQARGVVLESTGVQSLYQRGIYTAPSGLYRETEETLFSWLPKKVQVYTQEYTAYEEYAKDAINSIQKYCECEHVRTNIPVEPSFIHHPIDTIHASLATYPMVTFEMLTHTGNSPVLRERPIHSFAEVCAHPKSVERPWQMVLERIQEWKQEYTYTILVFRSIRNRNAFIAQAEEFGIVGECGYTPAGKGICFCVGDMEVGIAMEWSKVLIVPEGILYPHNTRRARSKKAFIGLQRYDDIEVGEHIIHKEYGIGKYCGLHRVELGGVSNDYVLLQYANDDKVYIPIDQIAVIQRYSGTGEESPYLDTLGGSGWKNSIAKAKKAIETVAKDLVAMYAERKIAKKHRYGAMPDIYKEFEYAFAFEETEDQAKAIEDVLDDMEKAEPMDRLICGDVGFGKTEIAIRACVRAALDGRQVAFLCPTTILAEQHYKTIQQRIAMLPLHVGLLSRFVSKSEQKRVLEGVQNGTIDILIGTHRLLSKDVHIPNLSLLVLDEEHRFGVRHKEMLKLWKKNIDALTLTATPIPRTLQLSMAGIRELSTIETPPVERKPIQSLLCEAGDECIKSALYREIEREGQIFWVYNRVQSIEERKRYIAQLCPEAKIGIVHGQMNEKVLEETIRAFWHGELDILLATSIIESGLDFPLANTIIIDSAHMFGLSQLYQLRGRVGRGDRQAYAIFVIPEKRALTEIAYDRLQAIVHLDYLGAGFHVAMEDLRIRGAGNILGEAQSGHIGRIGIELYIDMLESEVKALQAGKTVEEVEKKSVEVALSIPVFIPETYITDEKERLRYYQQLSRAQKKEEFDDIYLALQDRFGTIPEQVYIFSVLIEIKMLATTVGITKLWVMNTLVRMKWQEGQSILSPSDIFAWVEEHKEYLYVVPPASIECKLQGDSLLESLRTVEKVLRTLATCI